MLSLKIHTTKPGQWSQHSLPRTQQWERMVMQENKCRHSRQVALTPKYLFLSRPRRRLFPTLDFPVLEASGLHGNGGSHFTTWTPSIAVAWCSSSWIFLLASCLWQPSILLKRNLHSHSVARPPPKKLDVPSLWKCVGSLKQLFLFSPSSLIMTFNKLVLSVNIFRAKEPSGFQEGH